MSNDKALGDEPADDAGEERIRLDADRTRDALEDTLDELEARLNPTHLLESLKNRFSENPVPFVAGAALVVGIIVGIALLASRAKDGRG